MAADIPPIVLEFKGDITGIKDSLVKVENQLNKFDKSAKKSGDETKHMGAKAVAVGAVMANVFENLAHKAFDFAKESVTAYTSVAKETKGLMRTLGGTAEQMSRLDFASKHLGVSTGVLTNFMVRVGVHLSANDKAAARLGVSYRDARGQLLPSVTVLGNLADKFAGLPAGLDKTTLAVKTFGRGGIAMLPILNQGSKGLQDLYEQADKLGLTLSGKNLKDVSNYTSAQKHLHSAIQGVQFSIGKELVPRLTTLIHFVTENVIPRIRDFINGLMGVKDKLNGSNTAAYNWGKRIADIVKIAWHFRNVIINVGLVLLGMWMVSKIASAAGSLIKIVQGVIEVYNLLKTSAIVAGFAELWAANPFVGFVATVAGVLAAGAIGKYVYDAAANFAGGVVKDFDLGKFTDPKFDNPPPLSGEGLGEPKGSKQSKSTAPQTLAQQLAEQARQAVAERRLRRMGASEGLIQAIMGSNNWEKEYKNILAGGKNALKRLQNLYNKTDDGQKEMAAAAAAKFVKTHKAHLKKINDDVTKDTKVFDNAFAKSTTVKGQLIAAKSYLKTITPLITAALDEEKKTRGTDAHAAALATLNRLLIDQSRAQSVVNRLTQQGADNTLKQAQAAAEFNRQQAMLNRTMTASNSWMAAQVRTAGVTSAQRNSFIEVPVIIDGQTLFRVVQKHSLNNDRRNVSNGLAKSGSTIG